MGEWRLLLLAHLWTVTPSAKASIGLRAVRWFPRSVTLATVQGSVKPDLYITSTLLFIIATYRRCRAAVLYKVHSRQAKGGLADSWTLSVATLTLPGRSLSPLLPFCALSLSLSLSLSPPLSLLVSFVPVLLPISRTQFQSGSLPPHSCHSA